MIELATFHSVQSRQTPRVSGAPDTLASSFKETQTSVAPGHDENDVGSQNRPQRLATGTDDAVGPPGTTQPYPAMQSLGVEQAPPASTTPVGAQNPGAEVAVLVFTSTTQVSPEALQVPGSAPGGVGLHEGKQAPTLERSENMPDGSSTQVQLLAEVVSQMGTQWPVQLCGVHTNPAWQSSTYPPTSGANQLKQRSSFGAMPSGTHPVRDVVGSPTSRSTIAEHFYDPKRPIQLRISPPSAVAPAMLGSSDGNSLRGLAHMH